MNTINVQEFSKQSVMLPTAAALFQLTIGTVQLLESQDQSTTLFMGTLEEAKTYNEKLDVLVGTLSMLQDKLVDFEGCAW